MIEQTLTVVALDGHIAYLEAQQKQACEGCNGRCGSQVFGKLFGTAKKTFPYRFDLPVEVGQKVTLSLDDSLVVKHAFAVYMLPLFLSLTFAFIASELLLMAEGWQILAAALGGITGFFIAKTRVKSLKHDIKVIKIHPISIPLTQIDGD
ncbi:MULTISPECIES: SoxR reducing system RseC family protein [Pseudoalteromonas]|uniref:Regulator n=1 Tax=Pseudoalteromonas fuliginea TaxID=1872678 RepID=A0A063KV33_9GAMM|nr:MULTISPECIES: SoxR reducing system RseC family protein [Pseudoalteromonas]KAA1155730.1 regulator [Pseudoalteromonas fuliginea]KAA1160248.1 regulator [Pseudoalteromonas fuliginea]KAA1167093.1 regulator [Pseudoalteromonas fuliginea]KDC51767.1 regulator [Pseudoalteromonas fuliginea]KDC53549.1 regulator [Pseudoalteromonas sp. S3431]